MVELLEHIDDLSRRVGEIRERLGPATDADRFESRVRSVYASLAIEDPSVTLEEVREVLIREADEQP